MGPSSQAASHLCQAHVDVARIGVGRRAPWGAISEVSGFRSVFLYVRACGLFDEGSDRSYVCGMEIADHCSLIPLTAAPSGTQAFANHDEDGVQWYAHLDVNVSKLSGKHAKASLLSWENTRSQLVCSRIPTSSAALAQRAQPEPAITLTAAIRLPRRKQTHGPFPPSPSRPANGSEPLAVRTMNLQPAATTVRSRHICQSASRCVCVQAQLVNAMSFYVITLRK